MDILTPVLLKREDNDNPFKLIYLVFKEDGSILLQFPRKKKYKVRSYKDIPVPIQGEVKLTLNKVEREFIGIYLTYHPGKQSIHINSSDDTFQNDKPILNMGENYICFPFVQIILPVSIEYLDSYNESYTTPLRFNYKKQNNNIALSLSLWVHPVNTHIDIKDLPLIDKVGNIIGYTTFANRLLTKYTVTILSTELKTEIKDRPNPGIIVTVYNNEIPYVFELEPLL